MSRAGEGGLPVLTEFQPKWLELRLEKADFRQKKTRLAVKNPGRLCRGSAGVMSIFSLKQPISIGNINAKLFRHAGLLEWIDFLHHAIT